MREYPTGGMDLKKISLAVLLTFLMILSIKASANAGQLQDAADYGNVAMVRQLLDQGANINARDKHGDTALMAAAFEGHADVVKLLLEKGAKY